MREEYEIYVKSTAWVLEAGEIIPIDGTSNFINRKKDFAISLAFGEVNRGVFGLVYDVMAGNLYHAHKGSGAFMNDVKLSPFPTNSLLENELLAINTPWRNTDEMKRWGYLYELATKVRGEELGGKFSDLEGNDIDMLYSGGVAAASGSLHEQIIRSLKEAVLEAQNHM